MDKLTVDKLNLSYGAFHILKDVDLTVRKGEIIVLLGPSGSGKTTLLRAIAGLEKPQQGRIAIDGRTVFDGDKNLLLPSEKRDLGLVFQSYALWPHRTARENVGYGLKLRGTPKAEADQRVSRAMTNLGLGHLLDRYPHELSGGQQQRVAIARALVYNPPVLLLDEPLSNLDARLRDEAKAWLRQLIVESGLSAIMVTHDQTEALAIADKVVLLRNGIVVQEGAPEEVYHNPDNLFTAQFFGSTTTLTGTLAGLSEIDVGGQRLSGTVVGNIPNGENVAAVIRTEKLALGSGPGPNRLTSKLIQSMFLGAQWEHFLDANGQTVRIFTEDRLSHGIHHLVFDPATLRIFPAEGSMNG